MKLKTLLLGSAAAMIAVSGARAADAVVAEPEPMDYVKVCDMYGAGFWYIPGTETCMNINGYARVEYIYTTGRSANIPLGVAATNDLGVGVYRGRINFDVRNETDWGTLRSQIRIQGGDADGGGDAAVGLDRVLISVGGLRMGYSDSFATTNHGYGWQKAAWDGYYDYDQSLFLDYTIAANGFSATVGVQDSVGPKFAVTAAGVPPMTLAQRNSLSGNGSHNPDVYVGASYSGSLGRIAGTYIYVSLAQASAWKVSGDLNVIENLGIHSWYFGDGGNTLNVTGGIGNANVAWEWGVDINYQINPELNVWVGFTDADFNAVQVATGNDGRGGYGIGVGAIWDPIPGLSFRPEAVFFENDTQQYRLRVVRSF